MANILDIGRSGLLAYRNALTVTSENIANVNTDGYRRREVMMSEIPGAAATPLTMGDSGAGVRVEDVRRAFDALLAERSRTAGSMLNSAQTYLSSVTSLETQLQPGDGGVIDMMDAFFDAAGSLSVSPGDLGLRSVFIEAGKNFAASVADVAQGLDRLRANVAAEAEMAAQGATRILTELEQVQGQMSASNTLEANNPLLDRRDQLISDLADLLTIRVGYGRGGMATITLGDSGGGPVLLDGAVGSRVTFGENGAVTVTANRPDATPQARQPLGGMLHGYAMALTAIDNAVGSLNDWATTVVSNFNTLHGQGLDLTGTPGDDLFALGGWQAQVAVTNRGQAGATVSLAENGVAPESPLLATYQAATGEWSVADASGSVLGMGASQVTLGALSLRFDGPAADGDIIRFDATNRAENMRFVLTDPLRIAAARSTVTSADAGNLGTASLGIAPAPVQASGLEDLSGVFTGSSAADATAFLRAGPVGVLPAGADAVSLASNASQARVDFLLPGTATGFGQMQLGLEGAAYSFDLTGAGTDAEVLAQALNDGTILSASGDSFADLGLTALATPDGLRLIRARGNITGPASLATSGGPISGTVTPKLGEASELRLFTREGSQISGPPMTEAEAAAFLTEANGFLPGAIYSTEALNRVPGYRGLEMSRASATGDHVLRFAAGGAPVAWSGPGNAAAAPEQTLSVNLPGGPLGQITAPEGSSAARLAGLMNEAFSLNASATTVIEFAAPSDGTLSFGLEGDNITPLEVSAMISGGGMEPLAARINDLSRQTGIRAEVSPDGGRIRLIHAGGENITLREVAHDGGDSLSVRRLDANGTPQDATPLVLGPGAENGRFAGVVTLAAEGAFVLTRDGVQSASGSDPLMAGLVALDSTQAGSQQSLRYTFDPALDGTTISADGAAQVVASTAYRTTITGSDGTDVSVTVDAANAALSSGADVAVATAAAFRDRAPTSSLTGAALPSLPADGSEMAVVLGAETYVLRMQNGAVTVTGPEADRITAGFDVANRLQIATNGGQTDGAALRLATPASGATGFGLSPTSASTRLSGQPVDLATLPIGPSQFDLSVGGAAYTMQVTNTGSGLTVAAPAGFPGTASFDAATGVLSFDIPQTAGPVRIAPQADASALGFATLGASLSVQDGSLIATATDGRALQVGVLVASATGPRLSLTDLPDEDLIVSLVAGGAQRLSGQVTPGTVDPASASVNVVVADSERGLVDVLDAATGDRIATRQISPEGTFEANGTLFTLTGSLTTGDRFTLRHNADGQGDAGAIEALADLRLRNPGTGIGGFGELFDTMVNEAGSQVIAARDRETSAIAIHETALRAEQEKSGVDLDTEAARLIEQQQAYQANAQVLAIARSLFDTLMNSI